MSACARARSLDSRDMRAERAESGALVDRSGSDAPGRERERLEEGRAGFDELEGGRPHVRPFELDDEGCDV